MIVLCRGDKISLNDLPPYLFAEKESISGTKEGKIPLMKMISDLEKRWMISKLKESDWNQEKAAKLLGITRKMLMSRMKKYDIKIPKNKVNMV
jgi:transcriptional regulator of acetoin/glycerol metabolism